MWNSCDKIGEVGSLRNHWIKVLSLCEACFDLISSTLAISKLLCKENAGAILKPLLIHCCMKCPQILREKTSSEKYTVFSLKIQWKVFAFRKCQQIILPLIIINAIIFRGQN